MSDGSSFDESGLYDASRVHLFGKKFKSIRYVDESDSGGGTASSDSDRRFARIYAFAFEGHYYKLPRPIVFLVPGKGVPAQESDGSFKASETGIESRGFRFASDIRVWHMDRLANTVCLDVESGRLEELLLAPAVAAAEEGASGRGGASSRSVAAGRSVMAARSVAAFRSVMVGPHQE